MNENAKIRVLIAEDDPIQNDLLKDALELESDMACCGQGCDGLEALAKLQTEQPDVLLLDIVMPNMDGVDLLNELRENPPPKRPKVIAISAYGQEHIARAALAQGADWFLLKPYQLELLMRRIRTLAGEAPSQKKCTLEHIVSKAVIDLGVQTSAVGFLYLEQALLILLTHQGTCLMSKDVYAEIAARNGTTEQCVEKALRKVIQQIFEVDSEALHALLKLGHKEDALHLSNGRFLTLMAAGIRLHNLL